MKLKRHPEVTTIRQTETIELAVHDGEPITLEIQDLPPDYGDQLEAALPTPQPPKIGPLRDGGRIVKDDHGRPLWEYNWHDPDYLKAMARHGTLSAVFAMTEGIVEGQIEFDSELDGDAGAHYARVLAELKAFGVGIGQVTLISDAVRRLSRISDEDLERARRDFSGPGEG